jgi:predicted membrane-bound spermidine synthase
MPAASVPERLRIAPALRRTVLAACSLGTVAGALLWPLVDEPDPAFGVRSLITKTGAGTVIGLCLVLACYAIVWQVRRLVAVSEGA